MIAKDIALAPLYLYQGLKLRRTALRLPEASGERHGYLKLGSSDDIEVTTRSFELLLAGDSSAAGVGVSLQQDALIGHLLTKLMNYPKLTQHYNRINWSLHATSGHTTFDTLRRLYVLKKPETAVDVMIVLVGVNDTTANISPKKWQRQLREIIRLSRRKFGAKHIIFVGLPPMQDMPAIPKPLNQFLGKKIDLMNNKLIEVCDEFDYAIALPLDFTNTGLKASKLFAKDGFHPNSVAYEFLAKKLAKTINALV